MLRTSSRRVRIELSGRSSRNTVWKLGYISFGRTTYISFKRSSSISQSETVDVQILSHKSTLSSTKRDSSVGGSATPRVYLSRRHATDSCSSAQRIGSADRQKRSRKVQSLGGQCHSRSIPSTILPTAKQTVRKLIEE